MCVVTTFIFALFYLDLTQNLLNVTYLFEKQMWRASRLLAGSSMPSTARVEAGSPKSTSVLRGMTGAQAPAPALLPPRLA